MAGSNYKDLLSKLEVTLNQYFGKNAPALPENVKEFLVKIAPYLIIISLIFSIPAIMLLLGLISLGAAFTPMSYMHPDLYYGTAWIGILFLIPIIILQIMALPGLFSRQAKAWKYMYWARLISVVSSLVMFNVLGAILSGVVGFYLLFQVKSLYK